MKKILVIDDDIYICNLLVNFFEQNAYNSIGVHSGKKAKELIEKEDFDIILCDYRLPDTNGLKILKFLKAKKPYIPLIIITAYADIKQAVNLIKEGAYDYVTKPVQPDEIKQLIIKATEVKNTEKIGSNFGKGFVKGKSKKINEILKHVEVVAPTELPVLIEGETGSGKEYIARAIHYQSKRKNKPFIAVDCGAIPKDLANSELFGHVKGAFTGAVSDKKGHFEIAKGGTLFLDEVGNLPHENQVKLLRAIQERTISKVGDNAPIKINIRLISAANEDLLKQVNDNDFREDLYHRLNGFKIILPPLRDRKEDIMEFAQFFIGIANKEFNKNVSGIDDEVKELFFRYKWHGNLRELQNVLNRAVLLSKSNIIKAEDLPDEIRYTQKQRQLKSDITLFDDKNGLPDLKESITITEKEVIMNALEKTNFNKSKAAKMLNIDRKTLYNKIKLYDIEITK